MTDFFEEKSCDEEQTVLESEVKAFLNALGRNESLISSQRNGNPNNPNKNMPKFMEYKKKKKAHTAKVQYTSESSKNKVPRSSITIGPFL